MARYKLDEECQYIDKYIPCFNCIRKDEISCRCSLLSDYQQELIDMGIRSSINEQFIRLNKGIYRSPKYDL